MRGLTKSMAKPTRNRIEVWLTDLILLAAMVGLAGALAISLAL